MKMHISMFNDVKRLALAMVGALAVGSVPARGGAGGEPVEGWQRSWTVTGIDVKDGGGLKYAQNLATEWVKNQEYAKAQGWISGTALHGARAIPTRERASPTST